MTGFRTKSILCLPIFVGQNKEQELLGVASLINKKKKDGSAAEEGFDDSDIRVFKDLLILVGTALKNARLYEQTSQLAKRNQELLDQAQLESEKAKILLEVAKITGRSTDVESLIKNILDCAKKFVKAQVSSLFLVDSKKNELYSTVFESNGDQQKIIFPMSSGVAGSVATSGKTANIPNAYLDCRFNSEFDKMNNFKTVSLLSVPIFGPEGEIVGVTNLINKLDSNGQIVQFSSDDQSLFEGIAVFCGLALYKAVLIDEIQAEKNRLKMVMEIIGFHARTRPEEVEAFMDREQEHFESKAVISSYQYDPHKFLNTDDNLGAIAHQIFLNLQYEKTFEINDIKLVDYILTVRRNYRPIAYHNFTHAVSVTHGLFVFIVNGILDTYFTKLEMFSMLVACLNHDIDVCKLKE